MLQVGFYNLRLYIRTCSLRFGDDIGRESNDEKGNGLKAAQDMLKGIHFYCLFLGHEDVFKPAAPRAQLGIPKSHGYMERSLFSAFCAKLHKVASSSISPWREVFTASNAGEFIQELSEPL